MPLLTVATFLPKIMASHNWTIGKAMLNESSSYRNHVLSFWQSYLGGGDYFFSLTSFVRYFPEEINNPPGCAASSH